MKIKCECTNATGFGVICDCKSWKTCDYKNYKRKEQEFEKLKQTLTEIKEIAKDNFYYLDCDYRWVLENILQKISECEVKNENKL